MPRKPEQASPSHLYAAVGWTIADIQEAANCTRGEAMDWLEEHEDALRDAMIRNGHEAIHALLSIHPLPEEEKGDNR